MKQRILVIGLLLVGLSLLGLGQLWSRLVPSSAYWGNAQAKEYTDAQHDLHEKSHQDGHDKGPTPAFKAAHDRFQKINGEFERAKSSRQIASMLLTATGVLLLLVAIGLHWAGKESA